MSQTAIADPSTSPAATIQSAAEQLRSGAFRQSEETYRRVLRNNPDHADALHGLGLIAMRVGKPELAGAYFGRAAEVSPQNAIYKYDHGEAWMKIGDFNQAIACYRRAIALDPATPEPHAGLGIALARMHRSADAVESLQKSIELGCDRAEVYQQLGNALLQLGRFAEAEAAARKAVMGMPNAAECWQTLGEAIGNQQRPDEAMECFRKAISLKADLPVPHFALGVTLARSGRVPEAIDSLRMALRLRPEFPEAMSNLGTMLVSQRKLDEAVQTLRKAVQLRPNHLDSHVELARALELAQRPQEAAEAFKEILKLSPNNQNVMFHMAALSGKNAPPVAPPSLVTALFNRHADTFDQHLIVHLEYRVPQLLKDALAEAQVGENLDTLDLGCGTGLCGELLRPIARTLAGVDLSAAMIEKARQRGVYDRLEVGEVSAVLRAAPAAYDLLVAGDVLCYLGDLYEVFAAASSSLRPGGYFAFSVEADDAPGWVLRPSRRYAHNSDYLRATAARCGLEVMRMASMVLRKEGGKDVNGLVTILRRPAGASRAAVPHG